MGKRSSFLGSFTPFPAATFNSPRSIGAAIRLALRDGRMLQSGSEPGPLLANSQVPKGCSHLLPAPKALTARLARAGSSGAASARSRSLTLGVLS